MATHERRYTDWRRLGVDPSRTAMALPTGRADEAVTGRGGDR